MCYIKHNGDKKEREKLEEIITDSNKEIGISLNKQSGARMGDEQKAEKSEAWTGSGNHMFGNAHSDEAKAKMSEAKKGKGKLGDKKIIEIIKLLIKGGRTQTDISKEFEVIPSIISRIKTGYFKGVGCYSRFHKINLD